MRLSDILKRNVKNLEEEKKWQLKLEGKKEEKLLKFGDEKINIERRKRKISKEEVEKCKAILVKIKETLQTWEKEKELGEWGLGYKLEKNQKNQNLEKKNYEKKNYEKFENDLKKKCIFALVEDLCGRNKILDIYIRYSILPLLEKIAEDECAFKEDLEKKLEEIKSQLDL